MGHPANGNVDPISVAPIETQKNNKTKKSSMIGTLKYQSGGEM